MLLLHSLTLVAKKCLNESFSVWHCPTPFSSQKDSVFLAIFIPDVVSVALQPKLLQDLIFVLFSLQFAALGLAEYNTVSQTVKDRACGSVSLSCPASGRKLFEVS